MAAATARPAGVAVDLEVILDDAEVQRLLAQMIAKGLDATPAMKKIAAVAYKDIADIFRAEGKPTKWAPLAPITVIFRRKGKKGKAGTPKILRDTGRGFASVTSGHAEGAIYLPRPSDLTIGTRVGYMAEHMTGRGPRTETLSFPEHSVKAHKRTIAQAFGRPIKPVIVTVSRHVVRAHKATFHFGRMPRRVFIQWSDSVIEKARLILADHILSAAKA
jgi:phage gpG-like protein